MVAHESGQAARDDVHVDRGAPAPLGAGRPALRVIAGDSRSPLMRNAYTLVASAAVMSGLGVVYWAVAARLYPSGAVGVASAMVALMMLVSTLCMLGMPTVLLRFVPAAGPDTGTLVERVYLTVGSLSIVAGVIAALTAGLWSEDLAFLGDGVLWPLAFGLGCAAWSVFSLQDPVLTGLRRATLVTVENAAHGVAKLVLLVPFAAAGTAGALYATWIVPTALLVAAITAVLFGRVLARPAPGRHAANLPTLAELARFGGGSHLGSVLAAATAMGAPLLVSARAGSQETAYFYVAWMFSVGLQLVVSNMAMSLTVESVIDGTRLHEFTGRIARGALLLLVPAVLVLALGAPLVLQIFGSEYAEHGTGLLRLLAIAALPNVAVVTAVGVARALGNWRLAAAGQAVVLVLTLGIAYPLLDRMGVAGLGVGWLVAQCAVGGVSLVWLRRVIRARPPLQGAVA